uniref:Caspase-1 n=1 Tax=Cacopsylla melanoneura TaxID=428564 RepID=A0A8D8WAD9_9HEMI
MSGDYELSKMYYKFDEEDDDDVFVSDNSTTPSSSIGDTRGIIIPQRTRRVSDVIDSLNCNSPCSPSPHFKRHSLAEFPFPSARASDTSPPALHKGLKESKSESDSIHARLASSCRIMESPGDCSRPLSSLPSTPGSDPGYGSCVPTPTQMVYRPSNVFRFSSSTFESTTTSTQITETSPTRRSSNGGGRHFVSQTDSSHEIYTRCETDAQPSNLATTTTTQSANSNHHSPDTQSHCQDIEVPMPVAKDSTEYNMSHARRGRAIVFNHDEFQMDNMTPRPGSGADVKNLEASFDALGFQVSVYTNPEFREITEILSNLSQEDHSDADCLVVAVLTHGLGERYLWAHDMPYFVEKLWLPFTADKCRTLAGKPKIFFIQACRGTKLDGGVRLVSRANTETDAGVNAYKIPSYADFLIAYSTVEDGKLSKMRETEEEEGEGYPHLLIPTTMPLHTPYKIPTIADFLIAYSTAEGFYSWRHPENGTWFIQCLCQELADSGSKLDLLSIMTRVSRRVALDMESYNDLLSWQHQQKQVPSINSMLIRDVIFKPKTKQTS